MERKVALVTGASRGIGKAISSQLAQEGYNIVINFVSSENEALALESEIKKITDAIAIQSDVSVEHQVKYLIKQTVKTFGKIDVLINNAGKIFRPSDWKNIDKKNWTRTIDVNLMGTFNCIRNVAPLMISQKKGKIINITSTYGITGAAPVIAYTSAKAGIINLTLSFAKELAPYINVNAVAPGHIFTDMLKNSGEDFINEMIGQTPLRRIGKPEEVAYLVSFLASPKSDFITGQVIAIDGGGILR